MRDYIIHFIRHGETLANEEAKYIGNTDLPITKESADKLRALAEEGIYPSVGIVYTSPLKRAIETAGIIYKGKETVAVADLREYDFGDFEGKTDAELESDKDYKDWRAGKRSDAPGGEDQEDFKKRIYTALFQIIRNMSEEECFEAAVVTHGGVIMTLLALCGLPQKSMHEWICEPGKGFSVRINPNMFSRSGYVEVFGTVPEA